MMPDVNVGYFDLPVTIPAFAKANSDGSYTIILNSRHSYEKHIQSYQHEIKHILNGDYDRKCSVDIIELFAHAPNE